MNRGIIRVKKVCTQTEEVLEGAEFDICARDDIVRDGVTIAKAGDILDHIVTDSNGMGSTVLLPADTYYIVRETKAPDGYTITKEAAEGIEVYLTYDAATAEGDMPVVEVEVDNALMNCDFMIHKVIIASDIVWANGNPTFLFKVTGEDLKGRHHTYARVIEFTKAYVESHTDSDGNVRMSAVFTNIPCGRSYAVTESDTNRYVLVDVTSPDSNISVRRLLASDYGRMPEKLFKITADLYEKPHGSSVTFHNKKIRWDDWSHNTVKTNRVE